jgi:uncharacterized protein (DUF58 family)
MSADILTSEIMSSETERNVFSRVFNTLRLANSALNHDFCPNANRFVYWLKNPFWVLVLAIGLSLTCGLFLSPSALFITGILALLAGIGICMPWLVIKGIRAKVTFDVRRSRVGQPVLVRLRVQNRWPFPVWGLSLVRGFAVNTSSDSREGVSLARVSGWASVEFTWSFTPQIRGVYPLIAPEIETAFPFGLYRAARKTAVEGHLVVWPSTVMLEGLPDTTESRQSDDQLADRRVGDFGDMLGTRAFRQGDSLRRIHWAQSARHQRLIVCERQAPATSSVMVTVDTAVSSHPEVNSERRRIDDSFELLISTAASICESLHRQHCTVTLAIGEQRIVSGESAVSFSRLMDGLAQATLRNEEPRSRRKIDAAGFGIAVTTTAGLAQSSAKCSGWHVVTVDPDVDGGEELLSSRSATAGNSTSRGSRIWIGIQGLAGLRSGLPQRWKGACNVR